MSVPPVDNWIVGGKYSGVSDLELEFISSWDPIGNFTPSPKVISERIFPLVLL